MTFNSLHFFIFFPLVCLFYYLIPMRFRVYFLLLASYYFYMNLLPVFGLLTAGITLSCFFFTRWIEKQQNERKRSRLMWANIVLIASPLLFFKYFPAVNHLFFSLFENAGIRYPLPEISLLLPVGISFYTFMAIGYTIDVFNEEVEAENNIGILALYISFFPMVLSGPIERAGNMLPQFHSPEKLKADNISKGLKLMLWGYFMKLVVADRLGIYIDEVYADVSKYNGTTLWITTFFYPFQVYGDLGGYSLIAIGTAKALGYDVMHNFRRPFFAVSISEFWRRWHISLITWITDYIYTPLAYTFRRFGKWGIAIALMLAFLISGLWHGAAITFVVWGLIQGIFLSVEAFTARSRAQFRAGSKLAKNFVFLFACTFLTFFLFAVSQIFGRAKDMHEALSVFKKMGLQHGMPYLNVSELSLGVLFLGVLLLSDFRDEYFPGKFKLFDNRHFVVRFASYLTIFLCIVFFAVVSDQFIYFKF